MINHVYLVKSLKAVRNCVVNCIKLRNNFIERYFRDSLLGDMLISTCDLHGPNRVTRLLIDYSGTRTRTEVTYI